MHPASWLAHRKLASSLTLIDKVILSSLAVIEDGEECLVIYIPYQAVRGRHTYT